jgi:RNA recognition motif-containing protein
MQGRTLYIGNLNESLRKEKLVELFSAYGSVLDVKIIGSNAFGFVEMSNQEEAEKAKNALSGYMLEGNSLKIGEARPKNYRTGKSNRY